MAQVMPAMRSVAWEVLKVAWAIRRPGTAKS